MTYNATHAIYVERALKDLDPGDFILVSNGADWNNYTTDHMTNAGIRVVSGIPFGHGALYLGNGRLLEMPINAMKVRDVFAKDRSNGAALVRCRNLTRAQRGRISQFAQAYLKENRTNTGMMSYDLVGLGVGAAGEVGTAAAKVTGGSAAGQILSPFMQAPATAATMLSEKVNELWGNLPALSCVSLITYAHAVAGNIIDDGFLSYPTHTTPGVLWDIANADKANYKIQILDFSKDWKDKPDTAPVNEGNSVKMGPNF